MSSEKGPEDVPDPRDGPLAALRWVLRTDHTAVVFARDAASSALAVVAIGLVLFAVAGVWPPMVAVESPSMEPHMSRGDLVFIVEENRFSPEEAVSGVVTYETGAETGYRTFGEYGNVVVYAPPDRAGPPIIHRARFHVNESENWYAKADPSLLEAEDCGELDYCPAPYDGFITKGDNNGYYDQTQNIAPPVRERWINGKAAVGVPWLGHVRLAVTGS
jgi:signal peptidase